MNWFQNISSSIKFRSLETYADAWIGQFLLCYKILDQMVNMQIFRHKMTPDILEK